MRQRYTELVVETWLPPLRVMVEQLRFTMQVCRLSCHVLACKVFAILTAGTRQTHLTDGVGLERLEALMPRVTGCASEPPRVRHPTPGSSP